jgi:hypothetical protein
MRYPDPSGDQDEKEQLGARRWHATHTFSIVFIAIVVAVGAALVLHGHRPVADRMVAPTAAAPAGTTEEAVASPTPPVRAPVTPRRIPASDEVEVCGVGIVKREDIERPEFFAQHFREQRVDGEQWLLRLSSSDDESVRAAGRYLAAAPPWGPADESIRNRLEACGRDAGCSAQVLRDAPFVAPNAGREIDALADAAATTSDPVVYAIAVQACAAWDAKVKRGGSYCQLITLDRWTQLDGDNLVPWLFRAAAADAQGDAATKREALYRASIATGSRSGGEALLARALPALPADLSELERQGLAVGAMGLTAAWVPPPLQLVMTACTAEAVRDANVRQVCDGLASVLAEKSNNLTERTLGAKMAERLGWPAERVAALKKELNAIRAIASNPPSDALDCSSLQRTNADFLRRAQMGEVAFYRARIAESNETVDGWAKRFADSVANLRLAAASAAAASAASVIASGSR